MKINFNESSETLRMAGEILQSSDNQRMHEVGQQLIEAGDRIDDCELLQHVFACYLTTTGKASIDNSRHFRLLNKLNNFLANQAV